jgi:hypothetical protein
VFSQLLDSVERQKFASPCTSCILLEDEVAETWAQEFATIKPCLHRAQAKVMGEEERCKEDGAGGHSLPKGLHAAFHAAKVTAPTRGTG